MIFKYLIIVLFLTSCTNKKYVLPARMEIDKVLKSVEDYDSLISRYTLYNRLIENNLSIRKRDIKDTLIPQAPYSVDYTLLLNNLSSNVSRKNDSIFIAYQVDSMKSISIDSALFSKIKISSFRHDYNCYEYYLPLFSVDLKKAYIQYYINRYNGGETIQKYILEKKEKDWKVIKKF